MGMIIASTTIMIIIEETIFLLFLFHFIMTPLQTFECPRTQAGDTLSHYNKIIILSKECLSGIKELYMNFILFASTLAMVAAIAIASAKNKKTTAAAQREYWQRERAANSTRRKSLDDLPYIKLPMEIFPMDLLQDVPKIEDYRQIILSLQELPIVNFTGLSNTDLKLRYGAPNIDLLTSYDQNYTLLVRTLQQWAQALYDGGFPKQACQLLEFSISTGTDVSATYRLLCQIYKEQGTPEKIDALYPVAETLNSAMQKPIVRILQESGQSSD